MSKTILYIEDNEQNFYLISVLIKTRGYDLLWSTNGQQGIDKARQCQPDLILLDIQLPVMDGYEVARRLKIDAATAAIPIVALTSYAMAGDREKALGAGCSGYIEKPINPDIFLAQIDTYLGNK